MNLAMTDLARAAAFLNSQGFTAAGRGITPELLELAFKTVPLPLPAQDGIGPAAALLRAILDWKNNEGEHRRTKGSAIDRMFIESGWSSVGVPKEEDAKISEWCGMAVVFWLLCAGFCRDMATSFLHTDNIAAFLTHGKLRNVNARRLDTEVLVDGVWRKVVEYHRERTERDGDPMARRVFFDAAQIAKLLDDPAGSHQAWIGGATAAIALSKDTLDALVDLWLPGDVIEFDWDRNRAPNHVGMLERVRVVEAKRVLLDCVEGNRTGLAPDGSTMKDIVAKRTYDLSKPYDRSIIYGLGRPSRYDFQADLKAR